MYSQLFIIEKYYLVYDKDHVTVHYILYSIMHSDTINSDLYLLCHNAKMSETVFYLWVRGSRTDPPRVAPA